MALIGQHQQTAFSDPQAGQSPISAGVVRGNDNAIRAQHNAHDADATIHIQTGTLAGRPAAGTANAVYMDENGRIYRDNGTAWVEVGYAAIAAGQNTLTGNLVVEGNFAAEGLSIFDDSVDIDGNLTISGNVSAGSYGPIPQADVTNLVTDLAGKAATSHTHNASAITAGTLDAARLPASFPNLSTTGTVNLAASVGTPNAFNFAAPYVDTGASTPVALGNAPVAGVGWAWIRAESNLGPVWMPVLRTV